MYVVVHGVEWGTMNCYFHVESIKSWFAHGVGLAIRFGIVSDVLEE
jgi:hypothetical protein